MPIAIKMPALSPTMEEGTLAKWLVKVGDSVKSGDIMAEIETDKATMEFEAVDEGIIADIAVAEGTEGVKVGTVIATLAEEGEDPADVKPVLSEVEGASGGAKEAAPDAPAPSPAQSPTPAQAEPVEARTPTPAPERPSTSSGRAEVGAIAKSAGDRVIASPLAKRIAADKGIDLASVKGSGPNGRIVKADVEGAQPGAAPAPAQAAAAPAAAQPGETPYVEEKLSGMRKTIARRLTESKQQVPHIYLTVDIRLDALLRLRAELNSALEARGVKLSVNDMLIKALAQALIQVPSCNVQFAGDTLLKFSRADIAVAVSIEGGLITPIVADASNKAISVISTEMKDLAGRARDGKLAPHEYQGGTASLSNMGMYGIKQFEAIINPPQAMIMAIGAGEKRPYVVDDSLQIATVMSATGSFDHRAIDGADGAQLMKAFKELCEKPLGLVA
jgi:pyruvate dehydrogenase E2 component (dihydrolipoamide acetyltransferase)